jgi:hypothetical protein
MPSFNIKVTRQQFSHRAIDVEADSLINAEIAAEDIARREDDWKVTEEEIFTVGEG